MSQYVRLFTPSDYSPPQGGMHAVIVLAAIAVVALIVGIVFVCLSDLSAGKVCVLSALLLFMIGGFVFSSTMRDAAQYTGTRQGSISEDNIALLERSYGIGDMRTEQKGGKSVDEFLQTENNPDDIQYLKIVAQSNNGESLRHLTLQIDKDNRLRVYDDTGSQHLIAPASTEGRG